MLLCWLLFCVLCCAALLAGLMVHAPGLEPGLGLSAMNEAIKDGLGVSSCRAEPAIFRPFCAGCLTMTSAEEGSVRFNGSVDERGGMSAHYGVIPTTTPSASCGPRAGPETGKPVVMQLSSPIQGTGLARRS